MTGCHIGMTARNRVGYDAVTGRTVEIFRRRLRRVLVSENHLDAVLGFYLQLVNRKIYNGAESAHFIRA